VLPHALIHTPEQLMRGGHFGAFCTFAAETAHKRLIKRAAQFSRVYASINHSQQSMFRWVTQQNVWESVLAYGKSLTPVRQRKKRKQSFLSFLNPLHYAQGWSTLVVRQNRLPATWEKAFLSAKVRLTHLELMRILCSKLGVQDSYQTHVLLATQLKWEFFGTLVINSHSLDRKFVGVHKDRRDFVRCKSPADSKRNTCLSTQILVFVKISGFQTLFTLPPSLRNPIDNLSSVTFALVRWLSPHPNAVLRDDKKRPMCVSPFDYNHALWTFTKTIRADLTDSIVEKHSSCYPSVEAIISEKTARFDLILPESFNRYMNCTVLGDQILETITLPFQ